jgi:hypothetical protein
VSIEDGRDIGFVHDDAVEQSASPHIEPAPRRVGDLEILLENLADLWGMERAVDRMAADDDHLPVEPRNEVPDVSDGLGEFDDGVARQPLHGRTDTRGRYRQQEPGSGRRLA